jgi:hypothetical protein
MYLLYAQPILQSFTLKCRGNHFQSSLVFIKKKNQIEIFFLKKTKTGSNRPVSVRFLRQKLVQTGLTRF